MSPIMSCPLYRVFRENCSIETLKKCPLQTVQTVQSIPRGKLFHVLEAIILFVYIFITFLMLCCIIFSISVMLSTLTLQY